MPLKRLPRRLTATSGLILLCAASVSAEEAETQVDASPQPAVTIADVDRERTIATNITERTPALELVWLDADGEPVPAFFMPAASRHPEGVVILLHDLGAHPDWPDVIRPLREALVAAGWAVIAPQLPLLAPGAPRADYDEILGLAIARIHLALAHLQTLRFKRLAVVGYGAGASAGLAAFTDLPNSPLFAFTAIGLGAVDGLVDVPFLDVVGALDESAVRDAAANRSLLARRNAQSQYRRLEIAGANHRFAGTSGELVKRVRGWLNSLI